MRIVSIMVRTAHIATASVVVGGVVLGMVVGVWAQLTLATGIAMIAVDIFRYRLDYFRFFQWVPIFFKLIVLGIGLLEPAFLEASVWIALIAGSLISHAPGVIRHKSLWGKPGPCAIEDDEDV